MQCAVSHEKEERAHDRTVLPLCRRRAVALRARPDVQDAAGGEMADAGGQEGWYLGDGVANGEVCRSPDDENRREGEHHAHPHQITSKAIYEG